MAEYMGPERKTHLRMLDLLSLNQRVVRMKARKLVTIERMKMWSSLKIAFTLNVYLCPI